MVLTLAVLFWLGRRGSAFGVPIGTAEPWPREGRGGGRLAWRGIAPWVVIIVLGAVWDALGIDTGAHEAHLTISALSQAFRALNALLLLVWISVGIGYAAARARRPEPPGHWTAAADHDAEAERPGSGVALGAAGGAPVGGHSMTPALLLPSSRPLGIVFWVGLLVVVIAVGLVGRRSAGRIATAGEFVRFISTATVANVSLMAVWAFAGYHLFAR